MGEHQRELIEANLAAFDGGYQAAMEGGGPSASGSDDLRGAKARRE